MKQAPGKTGIMKNERKARRSQDEITEEFESDPSANLLSDVESQEPKEYEGVASHDRSAKLRTIGVIFAIFFLLFLSISSIKRLSYSRVIYFSANREPWGMDDIETGSQERTLGIKLHPQHHENRPAKTITHRWAITSGYRSPDGVKKKVYLVNGEFPGPTIECRSGDRLVIHVENELESEGISIHWHGLYMRNANSMDGAVGITQCPIPGGKSFTYNFEVDENQSGTFWWHAHSEVQRGDGMYGGLVVHKPVEQKTEADKFKYDQDVLLLIEDWYHRSSEEVLEWYMSPRGFGNEVSPSIFLHFTHSRLHFIACARFIVDKWSGPFPVLNGGSGTAS